MDAETFNDKCDDLAPKVRAGDNEARETLADITFNYARRLGAIRLYYHPPNRHDFDADDVAVTSSINFMEAIEQPRESEPIENYAGFLSFIVRNDFVSRLRKKRHEIPESDMPQKDDGRRWLENDPDPHSFDASVEEHEKELHANAWDKDHGKYLT